MNTFPLVDIHCHFVPGVDDGARTLEDALSYLSGFVDKGIQRVVTTPHLDAGGVTGRRRQAIDQAYAELESAVREFVPGLQLGGSFEIRLEDPDIDLADPRLGLGTGGHLLVEFPMLLLPAYPDRILDVVHGQGWVPVLAHPERYAGIEQGYAWIPRWRDTGAVMCVNAGSLWGEYGSEAERVSRRMLADGQADVIASDHHSRPGRAVDLADGLAFLQAAGCEEQARLLMSTNPAAVLDGGSLTPVPGCDLRRGWKSRLRSLLRRSQ